MQYISLSLYTPGDGGPAVLGEAGLGAGPSVPLPRSPVVGRFDVYLNAGNAADQTGEKKTVALVCFYEAIGVLVLLDQG